MSSEKSLNLGSCPEGYWGNYTVSAQDSLAFLAGLFSITEEDLLQANPHITSPNAMEAGSKIHIPGLIPFPAGINFAMTDKELPFASGGGAFIHLSPEGGQSVSVIATLPTPSYFGSFDLYLVEVLASASNIFEGQLFATPDDPPSWAARVDLPFLTSLSLESEVVIRPFNSVTGNAGQPILQVSLAELPAMTCGTSEVLSITSEYDGEEESNDADSNENYSQINDEDPDDTEIFDDIEVLDSEINNSESKVLPDKEVEMIDETEVLAENHREDLTDTESELPRKGIIFDMAYKLTEKNKHHLPDDEQTPPEPDDLEGEANISVQPDEPGEEPIIADTDNITEEEDHSLDKEAESLSEEEITFPTKILEDKENQPFGQSDEPGEESIVADTDLLTEEEDHSFEEGTESLPAEELSVPAEVPEEDQPSEQPDDPGEEPIKADTDLLTKEEDLTLKEEAVVLPEEELTVETKVSEEAEIQLSEQEAQSLPVEDLAIQSDVSEAAEIHSEPDEHEQQSTADADVLTDDNEPLLEEPVEMIAEEDAVPDETESLPEYNSSQIDEAEKTAAEQAGEPFETSESEAPVIKPFLNLSFNSNKSTVKYSPYSSNNKNRVPVNIVLNGTAETKQAIGVASIQLLPSQLMIAALKLPDPASLGEQYKYYTAWLIDAGNSKTTSVNLKKMLNGVWVGQSSSGSLKSFDLIIITAEATQNTNEPAGPEVLIGAPA